ARVAGVCYELKLGEKAVPLLRRLGSRIAPDVGVVPNRGLVGCLEPDPVLLTIHRAEIDPALRIVVLDLVAHLLREGNEVAILRELRHESGLREHCNVGRAATLNLCAERRRRLISEA